MIVKEENVQMARPEISKKTPSGTLLNENVWLKLQLDL